MSEPLTQANIDAIEHPAVKEWAAVTRTVGGDNRALPHQVESARHAALLAGDAMARALGYQEGVGTCECCDKPAKDVVDGEGTILCQECIDEGCGAML